MRDVYRETILTSEAISGAQTHARACFPEESVGVIHGGKYIAVKNVDPEPLRAATADPEVFKNMLADKKVDCLVHSHVDGSFWPSGNDMVSQVALNIPHGIIACHKGEACSSLAIWGERLIPPPLMGRYFQHGITDCYEALRDWHYLELGIDSMPPYPRNWRWWDNGQDLYSDNFQNAGFRKIKPREARYGDVILFKIPTRSKVNGRLCVGETYNHAGIYIDHDRMYHHPSTNSGYSPHNVSGFAALANRMQGGPVFLRMNERDT